MLNQEGEELNLRCWSLSKAWISLAEIDIKSSSKSLRGDTHHGSTKWRTNWSMVVKGTTAYKSEFAA
ncbi:hypothetical protein NC653_020956 [Populus alba x Populus x berolinensis]|uniref:Uncharacterized protein n=1 Tax=Populus alba x Populus x berolinensis TaxID=444605 RepID=A0AAD6MLQ8_9ROSI|nr:hypothetical protein NC653_020956 [Populus alba x Populus x berolinensis]